MKVLKIKNEDNIEELKEELTKKFEDLFNRIIGREITNPYLPGDWVILKHDIKDSYGEVWHHTGDKLQIRYLAKDKEGLMFHSNLGIHWTNVIRST